MEEAKMTSMPISGDEQAVQPPSVKKKMLKRKRGGGLTGCTTVAEREIVAKGLEEEIEGLFNYYKEVLEKKMEGMELDGCGTMMGCNGLIACLLEESKLPLSKLVESVFERLKGRDGVSVTMASVKSSVVLLGQRIAYGVLNEDADVLEDESDSCLWCWETRDLKMLPKAARMRLKVRRTCRKKIHKRITAVFGFLSALRNPENDLSSKTDLMRMSEKLCKVLNESDIRLLVDGMLMKNDTELSQKEAIKEEKLMVKQLENNKRELEKEKKRMDREAQREKMLHEKEQKRMQEESERQQEKEETELRKHQKKLQDEAEKEQRRREKEDAELKKQLALKKQASLMERFLKKRKTDSIIQNDKSSTDASYASFSALIIQQAPEPVIQSIDKALSQSTNVSANNLQKTHMDSWHKLGKSIRSNRNQHWGLRRKPKTELINKIKLSGCRDTASENDPVDLISLEGSVTEENKNDVDAYKVVYGNQKGLRRKQLLQFDKSFRPAFYGVWPKKSNIIGPRHPFKKDPELDYDVDSDEEWEEEEPGESLSDCEKDEEDEPLEDGNGKAEEEDESEDGFFVPDGYLSDNEGVQDQIESDISVDDVASSGDQREENEELCVLMRHLKYLQNLTEQALRKSQPLFISNLMHEKGKGPLLEASDLSGIQKIEQMCLQALSMSVVPGHALIEISELDEIKANGMENLTPDSKANAVPKQVNSAITNADLPKFVAAIQCSSHGMSRIVEVLQQSFPTLPKSLLKTKVRQLSDFIDNRWQVKREVLDDLGISPSTVKKPSLEKPSADKAGNKKKITITTFFSKRCLPPSETKTTNINPNEVSPEPPKKVTRIANDMFDLQPCQLCTTDEPNSP